jgi:hypothetical protein
MEKIQKLENSGGEKKDNEKLLISRGLKSALG